MKNFFNRTQLINASDEDILNFFEETYFEGTYTSEVRSKQDYYKGSIVDIKLNGSSTDIVPGYLNVPKTSNPIKTGACRFKCRLNIDAIRGADKKYIITLIGGSLESVVDSPSNIYNQKSFQNSARKSHNTKQNTNKADNQSVKFYSMETMNLMEIWSLAEPIGVGYFQWIDDQHYRISDFRNNRFRSLRYPEYEDEDEQGIIVIEENVAEKPISKTYKTNTYYQFAWRIESCNNELGYRVALDTPAQLKNIKPKELIDNLNSIWNDPDAADDMKDVMQMISSELMASSEGTFIYELLQNANDNAIGANDDRPIEPVDVEFYLTDNYLICRHTGDYFSPRDIAGVCKVAKGSKKFRKNAIGYKGIGFKTVFHSHNWVGIISNEYSFHFEERRNRPWQIMPIWNEPSDLPEEVRSIVADGKNKFRVVTIMKPKDTAILRNAEKNHLQMLLDMFKDVRDIIFIPNIRSVSVYDNGNCIALCKYETDCHWVKSNLPAYDISRGDGPTEIADLQTKINLEIASYGKERGIPGKYKDFGETTIAFACACEDKRVLPVDNATVNCYLPTKAMWGFPFLMNTDMVPSGDRNRLKIDVNFNASFAYIAGIKFVEWIVQLLKQGFKPSSVFDLIPNFEICKKGVGKEYENFINKFEQGFEYQSRQIAFVPTENANETVVLRKLDEVLIDKTGLMSSDTMSALDFYRVTGVNKFLLEKSLRMHHTFTDTNLEHPHFSFIKYLCCDIFNSSKLAQAIPEAEFQGWLMVSRNNDAWLKFLKSYPSSSSLKESPMFLSNKTDRLYSAKCLVFDKKTLSDVLFLESHLLYLREESRDILNGNSDFGSVFTGWFQSFNAKGFVDTITTRYRDELIELISNSDNNVHWHHFMMSYDLLPDKSYITILNQNNAPILIGSYFQIFFASTKASEFENLAWIDQSKLVILSSSYGDDMTEYFTKLGVKDANEGNLLSIFVATTDNTIRSNTKIFVRASLQHSLAFCSFVYRYQECLPNNASLKDFPLAVSMHTDTPDDMWRCADTDQLYWENDSYKKASEHTWIKPEWMHPLCNGYLSDNVEESTKIKSFFKKYFGVGDITDESFYIHVVKGRDAKHLPEILTSISKDEVANLDYVKYLSNNFVLIFDTKHDGETIRKNFKAIAECECSSESEIPCVCTYQYSLEAIQLCKEIWMPSGLVSVASSQYTQIMSNDVYEKLMPILGIVPFTYEDVCSHILGQSVPRSLILKECDLIKNVACHNYFIEHINQIAYEKIAGLKLPVYLEGKNCSAVQSTSSSNHILLDEKTYKWLTQFLQIEQLNLLHHSYTVNETYWVTLLENVKVEINSLVRLKKDDETEPIPIANLRIAITSAVKDKELNLLFWRGLKDSGIAVSGLKNVFPILCYESSNTDNGNKISSVQVLSKHTPCYISDVYFSSSIGNEAMLNEYAPGAFLQ